MRQHLVRFGMLEDLLQGFETLYDPAKRRKPVSVGLALSAEIEFGFIAHANKEAAIQLARIESRGRHRPLEVREPGIVGAFVDDGVPYAKEILQGADLHDVDRALVPGLLVAIGDDAENAGVGERARADQVAKILTGRGSALVLEQNGKFAEARSTDECIVRAQLLPLLSRLDGNSTGVPTQMSLAIFLLLLTTLWSTCVL